VVLFFIILVVTYISIFNTFYTLKLIKKELSANHLPFDKKTVIFFSHNKEHYHLFFFLKMYILLPYILYF